MSSPPGPASASVIRYSQNSNRWLLPAVVALIVVLLLLSIASLFFAVLALIVAVAFVAFRFQFLVASLAWHDPELVVEADFFDLGSRPVVTFQRRSRRAVDIGTCQMQTLVTCTEKVEYRQGSETRRVSRVVYEHRGSGEGSGTADGFKAELLLEVSAYHGAPTMKLTYNEIVWAVEIWSTEDAMPKDKHLFEIKVRPVIDARLQTGVQDS